METELPETSPERVPDRMNGDVVVDEYALTLDSVVGGDGCARVGGVATAGPSPLRRSWAPSAAASSARGGCASSASSIGPSRPARGGDGSAGDLVC